MKLLDQFKMHGAGTFILEKANGEIEVTHKDNLIVDVGFDFICDVIGNANQPGEMNHIGVGTGTTAAAANQTDLVTPLTRVPATYAHVVGTKVFTMTSTFNEGVATGAITEAGVFNALVAGIMLDRVVFPVINKGADDKLTAIFTFTLL